MTFRDDPEYQTIEQWSLPTEPAAFLAWLRDALPAIPTDSDRLRRFATLPAARFMPLPLAVALRAVTSAS